MLIDKMINITFLNTIKTLSPEPIKLRGFLLLGGIMDKPKCFLCGEPATEKKSVRTPEGDWVVEDVCEYCSLAIDDGTSTFDQELN